MMSAGCSTTTHNNETQCHQRQQRFQQNRTPYTSAFFVENLDAALMATVGVK
jgi:hypothetical protein